ncbi:hypothetical protein F5Y14DRAFT_399191 [Nemania sp. NC0429]|nr:hypothetical protein F5Y14DRAFT_399191 [Nemania sp. NC0429]
MATDARQIDHNQVPAVPGAMGHVLTTGEFQCTRMDRHGVPILHQCGSIMNNTARSIKSHIHKLHRKDGAYNKAQASYAKSHDHAVLVCDRPLLDGTGWCTVERNGLHSLVEHARKDHQLKGSSESLTTPWGELTDAQRNYYLVRVDLEVRCRDRKGTYTPEDAALREQFKREQIPRTPRPVALHNSS